MRSTPIAIAIVCSIILSGCASQAPQKSAQLSESNTVSVNDAIVEILTGKPVSFLTSRLGLPNRRNESDSGVTSWVYIDNQKGVLAKGCQISLTIKNDVVEHVNIETVNNSLASMLNRGCRRIRKDIS